MKTPETREAARPRAPFRVQRACAAAAALAAFSLATGCVVHTRPYEVVTAEVVTAPPAARTAVFVEESVDVFVEPLSPYGTWIVTPTCGRVWRPHDAIVGVGFEPYLTGGEWVYTDYGWSFETDWEWGWAVYHYGRWCPDPREGWVWVPGSSWASAWVEWRMGSGFVGWAPLLPIGIVLVEAHWIFVETHHFHHPDGHHGHDHASHHMDHDRLPPDQRHHAYTHTRPVHDVVSHGAATWPRGPNPQEVGRYVGAPVTPVRVEPPKPGTIRRPHVEAPRPPVAAPPVARPPEPVVAPKPAPRVVPTVQSSPPPVVRPPERKKLPPLVKPPERKKLPPVVKPGVKKTPVVPAPTPKLLRGRTPR